jgi:hypothetical protein
MGSSPSKSTPQPVYGPKLIVYKPYNVPDQNANPHLTGGGNSFSYYQPGYKWDPAVGCNKNFIGTYKCGKNLPKTVSKIDAANSTIYFDCRAEHHRCRNFVLELTTEGKLLFRKNDSEDLITEGIVSPNPFQAVNAAPRTNESVNPDQLPEDIKKLNSMVLDGKLPGLSRRFERYMSPLQELKRGEYLCSSTGNCMLVLDKAGNLEVRTLKFKTGKIGETMQGNRDSTSCALHELDGLNVDNLGRVANISVDGKRRMYSNGQLALGTKYVEIKGTDPLTGQTVTYDNPGDTLESISNDTGAIDYCFEQCTSRVDCGGFVVSQSDPGTCHLKNANMFPGKINSPSLGNRVQSNSTQLYKRLYAPKLVSESCAKPGNTNVVAIDSVLFDHYPTDKHDPLMTRNTLCGADQVVETPSGAFERAAGELTKMYDAVMDSISATINKQTQYNELRNDPAMDVSGKIAKYKKNSDEIAEYTEKQETIQGTEEDTRVELISETYKYVLWSILAIVIIIAIVYYGDVGSYTTNISSVTDIFKSSSTEPV